MQFADVAQGHADLWVVLAESGTSNAQSFLVCLERLLESTGGRVDFGDVVQGRGHRVVVRAQRSFLDAQRLVQVRKRFGVLSHLLRSGLR